MTPISLHESVWFASGPVTSRRDSFAGVYVQKDMELFAYAVALYENANGHYPDNLQILFDEDFIKPQQLLREKKGLLTDPLLYLGRGLTNQDPETILLASSPDEFARIYCLRPTGEITSEQFSVSQDGVFSYDILLRRGQVAPPKPGPRLLPMTVPPTTPPAAPRHPQVRSDLGLSRRSSICSPNKLIQAREFH